MHLFHRVGRDPAQWSVLWSVCGQLPMSLDPPLDASARIQRVLGSLSAQDAVALHEQYWAAMRLLSAPEFAAQVQPWPWRGFTDPFSPHRFRFAVERVITGGPELYNRVLSDPGTMAEISTGPQRSVYQRVCSALTYPTVDLMDILLADVTHPGDEMPVRLTDDYPDAGEWPGAPHSYAALSVDPEGSPIDILIDNDFLDEERGKPLPADASADLYELGRTGGWMLEDPAPSQHLVAGALIDAAAVCWNALNCCTHLVADGFTDRAEATFTLSSTWVADDEWVGMLDVTRLAPLPTEQLRAAATSLVAGGLARELGAEQPERAALVSLAQQYVGAIPPEGRARVTALS